jgi:hypothetical protein
MKEPSGSRPDGSERRLYVRTVTILVQITKVTITIRVGDETLVIEVPI